jgi:hypothetical protein
MSDNVWSGLSLVNTTINAFYQKLISKWRPVTIVTVFEIEPRQSQHIDRGQRNYGSHLRRPTNSLEQLNHIMSHVHITVRTLHENEKSAEIWTIDLWIRIRT